MEQFDVSFVEKLIDLAKKKKVYKLEVCYKDFKVLIDFKENVFVSSGQNVAAVAGGVNIEKQDIKEKESGKIEAVKGNIIKSPIVGTFYSSPAPDKPPFVNVGDKVKKGDVVFIIESMKLMNEIKSEFDGTVSEILVSSGDGVEYDQPIMILE